MRVISGYLKRRNLFFAVDKKGLRPTKDVIREAIFDVLRDWVVDKRVLDLFAGTGALGIEAVSHGAREVVFVESERDAVNIIRKNLYSLGITDICSIKKGKVENVVLGFEKGSFDLIIADPPYGYPKSKIASVLKDIVEREVIGDGGIVVFENRDRDILPEVPGLMVYKEKVYGKSRVSYLTVGYNEK
jgi:16S rRNA (guanine966-N2)-methyltransferase